MTVWVLKESEKRWPYDMLCVKLDEDRLLFIHEDGGWDIAPVECGEPTDGFWDRYEL